MQLSKAVRAMISFPLTIPRLLPAVADQFKARLLCAYLGIILDDDGSGVLEAHGNYLSTCTADLQDCSDAGIAGELQRLPVRLRFF